MPSLRRDDYYSKQDCQWKVVAPEQKYYQEDGSEHTLRDVPLDAVLRVIQFHISSYLPRDRYREVYDKVIAGVPPSLLGVKRDEDPGPNSVPATPFSASRAARNLRKSNAQLMDDLASAAGMEPKAASWFRGLTVLQDASSGGKFGMIAGTGKVSGGRLGRDHTLEDVPNCFVRDCVMEYIDTQLPADERQAIRKAVFSDLTKSQIDAYSELVAERMEKIQSADEAPGSDITRETERVKDVGDDAIRHYYHLVSKAGEMKNIARQEVVFEAIDDAIDLTPGPSVTSRDFGLEPISRSVVKPDSEPLAAEQGIQVERAITHNCNQVRAMVKRFIGEGEWTLDQFRLALGGVTRPRLVSFLEQSGPKEGLRGGVFRLCWEFFHRREKLGLPLVGAGPQRDEDLLGKRGAKRRSVYGDGGGPRGGKRPRTIPRGRA